MAGNAQKVTLQAVRAYVGEKSFAQGQTCARDGHVSNPRQARATIKADRAARAFIHAGEDISGPSLTNCQP